MKKMDGQIGIFEWLITQEQELPKKTVEIDGVTNVTSMSVSDYKVSCSYADIFIIINMLDDYIRLLVEAGREDYYTQHMIKQFERISSNLAEQIELDKDKMYSKCRKRNKNTDDIGEDALRQLFKRK